MNAMDSQQYTKSKAEPGDWGFSANCTPSQYALQETFSVGVFRWVAKAKGDGVKRGAIVLRVKGYCSSKSRVFKAAMKICQLLKEDEAGTIAYFPKTVDIETALWGRWYNNEVR